MPSNKKSVDELVGETVPEKTQEVEKVSPVQKEEVKEEVQQEEVREEIHPRPEEQRYERSFEPETYPVKGILDIQPEGHGFLRPRFIPSQRDIYISQSQIRRFMLRPGDLVEGVGRPPKDTERYFGLLKVEKVNDIPADESLKRPYFDDLTPIYPKKQITLSTGKFPLSTRIIDLISPIGFAQIGMVVSPPKA